MLGPAEHIPMRFAGTSPNVPITIGLLVVVAVKVVVEVGPGITLVTITVDVGPGITLVVELVDTEPVITLVTERVTVTVSVAGTVAQEAKSSVAINRPPSATFNFDIPPSWNIQNRYPI